MNTKKRIENAIKRLALGATIATSMGLPTNAHAENTNTNDGITQETISTQNVDYSKQTIREIFNDMKGKFTHIAPNYVLKGINSDGKEISSTIQQIDGHPIHTVKNGNTYYISHIKSNSDKHTKDNNKFKGYTFSYNTKTRAVTAFNNNNPTRLTSTSYRAYSDENKLVGNLEVYYHDAGRINLGNQEVLQFIDAAIKEHDNAIENANKNNLFKARKSSQNKTMSSEQVLAMAKKLSGNNK